MYLTVAFVLMCLIMAGSAWKFNEYKNSTEHLRSVSFMRAYVLYVIGVAIYSLFWIVSVPLTFILL